MNDRLTAEEFVRIWQTSETLDEVMQRTGMPRNNCASRASYYRKNGVALKNFVSPHSNAWGELRVLAQSLQEQGA